jgi:hypothetical protein
LVGVEIAEDQKHLWAEARTALVPTETVAVPLAQFKDLNPDTIIWLAMVFELLQEKYGADNHQLDNLSYTGEMVVDPEALVGQEGALVREGHYKALDLGTITHDDMAGSIENNWSRPPVGANLWMVERYGGQVPEEVYQLVGAQSREQLLPVIETGTLAPDAKSLTTYEARIESFGKDWTNSNPHLRLETLDPMTFGSKEDLHRDRIWTARFNQAQAIQRLADVEFKAERANVIAWYTERVNKNIDTLLDGAVQGNLLALPSAGKPCYNSSELTTGVHLRYSRLGKCSNSYMGRQFMGRPRQGGVQFHQSEKVDYSNWHCYLTGAKATVFAVIIPETPEDLAFLCGCGVEDLPLFLQHWAPDTSNGGNSILDRLDPIDYVLKNPWVRRNGSQWSAGLRPDGLALDVGIALSKNGFHRRRKELGLARIQPQELAESVDE